MPLHFGSWNEHVTPNTVGTANRVMSDEQLQILSQQQQQQQQTAAAMGGLICILGVHREHAMNHSAMLTMGSRTEGNLLPRELLCCKLDATRTCESLLRLIKARKRMLSHALKMDQQTQCEEISSILLTTFLRTIFLASSRWFTLHKLRQEGEKRVPFLTSDRLGTYPAGHRSLGTLLVSHQYVQAQFSASF